MRRPNWKVVGIAAGVALAIFLCVGIYRAGLNERVLPSSLQPMHLQNGEVINHRMSLKSWTFAYDDANVSSNGNSATITGVHDGIFYKKGKPYLKISATSLTLDRSTLDFTATGRVRVERFGTTNEVFDTDSVVWSNASKMLVLGHPSYVRTNGQTLVVGRVTVNTATNDVTIDGLNGSVEVKP